MVTSLLNSMARSTRRGNGAGSITSKADPLSMEDLSRVVPSILAADKHESRSARYTYVPTIQIVDHLQQNGYGIFSAMQSGSRDETKRGYTKHLIRFRPIGSALAVGATHPEMVLLNSHDGTSAYRLMAGIFRLVCSNGLIVAQSTVEDIRVRHSGNILGEISEAVERMRVQLPQIGERVEQFQRLQLSAPEQTAFANAALTVRYGTVEESPIPASAIVSPRRREDAEPTLWNTLNAVQESLIRGGNRYIRRTDRGIQRRTTGAVNSVDGNTTINRALWQLAEEMAKLKA